LGHAVTLFHLKVAGTFLPSHTGGDEENKNMKLIIPLSSVAVLAALALVGCNQNSPSSSTDAQSTNSSVTDTNGMSMTITNMPATNSLPDITTNMPTGTNQ
jgi:hypothetical protein